MLDVLSELYELTSSWHWSAYYGHNLEGLNRLMTEYFTGLQEHHRIEVVSTALNTTVIDNGNSLYYSILVTYKRYDKSKKE